MDVMNTVRIVLAAAAVAAMVAAAGTAGADPTPSPGPGYQIAGQLPGVEQYPPQCLRNMLACGFRYDAGTGAWNPPGTNSN